MRVFLLPSLLCIALCMYYATAQWSNDVLTNGKTCEELCKNSKTCNPLDEYKECKCFPQQNVATWKQFYTLPIDPGVMCLMSSTSVPKCCDIYKQQTRQNKSVMASKIITQSQQMEQLKQGLSNLTTDLMGTLAEQNQELDNLTKVWSSEPWKQFASGLIEEVVGLPGGVGFTAYLDHDRTVTTNTVVLYNKVITNVGGGYNSANGHFTCPEAGTYLFSFSAATYSSVSLRLALKVNNVYIIDTYQYSESSRYLQVSNMALVKVKKGEVVNVQSQYSSKVLKGSMRQTSFTGVLVHN